MPHGSRDRAIISDAHMVLADSSFSSRFVFLILWFSIVLVWLLVPHHSHFRDFWPLKLCCLFLPAFLAGVAFFLRLLAMNVFGVIYLTPCVYSEACCVMWMIHKTDWICSRVSTTLFSFFQYFLVIFQTFPEKSSSKEGERGGGEWRRRNLRNGNYFVAMHDNRINISSILNFFRFVLKYAICCFRDRVSMPKRLQR